MGQKFAAYDAQGHVTAFYDSVDSPPPPSAQVLAITQAQWQSAIAAPGYTVTAGTLTPAAPPSADVLLARAQADQIALVRAACQQAIFAGFVSSALASPHTYPAKVLDQTNLQASVLASLLPGNAADWTTPFWCADATGAWAYVNHTAAQIQQAGRDGKAAILAALVKCQTLEAAIAAASTSAQVQAVVW